MSHPAVPAAGRMPIRPGVSRTPQIYAVFFHSQEHPSLQSNSILTIAVEFKRVKYDTKFLMKELYHLDKKEKKIAIDSNS